MDILKLAKEDPIFRKKLINKLSSSQSFGTKFTLSITEWIPPDEAFDYEPAQVEGFLINTDFGWKIKFHTNYVYHDSWNPFPDLRMDLGPKWFDIEKDHPFHSLMVFLHEKGLFKKQEPEFKKHLFA